MAGKNKVEGADEVIIRLDVFQRKIQIAAGQGINMGLERIRTAAIVRAPKYVGRPNPRIIPGFLRASAFVQYVDPQAPENGGVVGFGAIYARRQHYETTWHHRIGEALYLQHAAEYVLPLIPLFIADAIRAALTGR
jgi:hypothetical protein